MHKRQSLSKTIIRAIYLIYFVFALLLTVLHVFYEFMTEKEQMHEEIHHLYSTLDDSIAHALWNLDEEYLRKLLASIVEENTVVAIRVLDDEGKIFAHADHLIVPPKNQQTGVFHFFVGLFREWKNKDTIYHFPVQYLDAERGVNKEIGKILISTTNQQVLQRAWSSLWFTILSAMIKTFFLWLIMYFVIKRWVSVRLTTLTSGVEQLVSSFKQVNQPTVLADLKEIEQMGHHQDEIGILANAFILMEKELQMREKAIIEYQKDLEQKVESRTLELNEMVDELGKALSAKADFFSNVSHELKTPMNAVIGFADLLKMTALTEKQKGYLDRVSVASNHLMNLIDDILEFSLLEQQEKKAEISEVFLHIQVGELLQLYQEAANTKNIKLVAHFEIDVPEVIFSDGPKIKKIIFHLLSNAIKFSDGGTAEISVCMQKKNEQIATLVIAIKDQGIGLTSKDKERILAGAGQLDGSLARKHGGLGLGLSFCRFYAQALNGALSVESEVGVGSTFTFKVDVAI